MLHKLGYSRGWGRTWLPEEDDMLRQVYETGASRTPLITRLGRTKSSINWRAQELGLRGTHQNRNGFRQGADWTPEQIAILRRDYGRVPTKKLAASLGRPLGGVLQKAWNLKLEHGYHRDFSEKEKSAIQIAYDRGISMTDLAGALGRDIAVVSKHAKRVMGLHFNARPNKARKTRIADRPKLTLANILALAGEATAPAHAQTTTASPTHVSADVSPARCRDDVDRRIAAMIERHVDPVDIMCKLQVSWRRVARLLPKPTRTSDDLPLAA
jgi:hypothetical protein